jgi:hypothetical protein
MAEHALIESYSPSLIGRLHDCAFRVYLDRTASRSGRPRPSSPGARLGNAAHRALQRLAEQVREIDSEDDAEALVRATWNEATQAEYAKAQEHDAERGLGQLDRWPGFNSIQEHLANEARAVFTELQAVPDAELRPEQRVASASGDLYGDPDLVVVTDTEAWVWDYKSGAVEDEDASPEGRYGRQLLLYATLIAETFPGSVKAEIRPLGRTPITVRSSPDLLEHARSDAAALVDDYNAAVTEDRIGSLAKPGERTCGWCPHLQTCSAVWGDEVPDLGSTHVIQGQVLGLQPFGSKVALRIDSDRGTAIGEVTVTGLDTRRLGALQELAIGHTVRITGLIARGGISSSLAGTPQKWVSASRVDDATNS